ncbi:hypothetical protein LC048_19970 [Mesobacillus subterraneus]|nr:hypothetical protein [Mesobacillus subterraneus]WLR54665.1 hypothetical protein LC048_19970 [Mesobacillus subterraneus]
MKHYNIITNLPPCPKCKSDRTTDKHAAMAGLEPLLKTTVKW